MSPQANHKGATEVTPLLAASEEGPTFQANEEVIAIHAHDPDTTIHENADADANGHAVAEDDEDQSLPMLQIFLLCYGRLMEPIAFFSIFPFISKMIEEVGGTKEEDVGFYAGLIESLFSLTQMTFMILWGRIADKFGRKPVLVVSLAGVSVAAALFGFSTSIWQMVVFRCLAGLLAGNVVTIRVLLSENSTAKTQARAFSLFAFAGNLGIFLGPVIGGACSNPADQYPRVFGHVQLFKDYPYALSSLVTGSFGISATILCALFVKEVTSCPELPLHPTN